MVSGFLPDMDKILEHEKPPLQSLSWMVNYQVIRCLSPPICPISDTTSSNSVQTYQKNAFLCEQLPFPSLQRHTKCCRLYHWLLQVSPTTLFSPASLLRRPFFTHKRIKYTFYSLPFGRDVTAVYHLLGVRGLEPFPYACFTAALPFSEAIVYEVAK